MSSILVKSLLVFYLIILIFCLIEHRWAMAEYWIGALLIVHATLWGMK